MSIKTKLIVAKNLKPIDKSINAFIAGKTVKSIRSYVVKDGGGNIWREALIIYEDVPEEKTYTRDDLFAIPIYVVFTGMPDSTDSSDEISLFLSEEEAKQVAKDCDGIVFEKYIG